MAYAFSNKFLTLQSKPAGFALDDDIEAVLLMANTTALADIKDAADSGDIGTLDVMDGSGYADKPVYLDPTQDDTNNRCNFISKDSGLTTPVNQLIWTTLGAGTRAVEGVLYRTTGAHAFPDTPIMYVELAEAKAANGEDFKVNLSSTGIIKKQAAA